MYSSAFAVALLGTTYLVGAAFENSEFEAVPAGTSTPGNEVQSTAKAILATGVIVPSNGGNSGGDNLTVQALEEIEGRVRVPVGTSRSQGCRSFQGGVGQCVAYSECDVAFENEFFARSSLCGFSNRRPLVCCPHKTYGYGPSSFQTPFFPNLPETFFQQNPFANSFFYTPTPASFYPQQQQPPQPVLGYHQPSYNPGYHPGFNSGGFSLHPPYGNGFSFRPATYRQPPGQTSSLQFYHNHPQPPNYYHSTYNHNNENSQVPRPAPYNNNQRPQYLGGGSSGIFDGGNAGNPAGGYGNTRNVNNQNPSSFHAGYAGYQSSQFARPQQSNYQQPTYLGRLPSVSQPRPSSNQFGLPLPYNPSTASEAPLLQPNSTLNSPYCGLANSTTKRIVGGREAAVGAWPWLALLFVDVSGSGYKAPLCGGALIDPTHVLTAAHCVNLMGNVIPAHRFTVRLGEHDYLGVDDGANPVNIDVSRVFSHPQFNNRTYLNDIAILRLQRPTLYGQGIAPICVPTTKGDDAEYRGSATVAGWGELYYDGPASSILQEVTVPIQTLDTCKEAFKRTVIKFNENYLCAGSLQGDRDTCRIVSAHA
ncbi:serine proteinase stubble-like isoform X2 [Varroa jacobsoni]|uniref:serine proteinase stubble-like isoform X2 n=1 Tax=Varroa jacobsoni TaxID=62625 RepID=UPI000BF30844|nr:serine proteinase stubble-like isoform X2 [Varroa jacobsoni]